MAWRIPRIGFVAAVALAAGLSGCNLLAASRDSARLHEQAQAALTRWADAVEAAGGPSAFIPVGELTSQVGDWEENVGSNNKPALGAGLIEADVSLSAETPPDGQVRWQDGSTADVRLISAQQALSELKADGAGECPDCVPLRITAALLKTGPVRTSRGQAEAPVWEFALQGTSVRVIRVAVANRVSVVPPPWDANDPPVGISIESATVAAGGRLLTVSFVGAPAPGDQPCGADYTAEAVESTIAVVVIVTEYRHAALGEACLAIGALRTADAQLAAPLDGRAVLEVREALPVPVLPAP